MDLEKLLEHCQTLEKTVAILVKSNSGKEADVARLQSCIIEDSQLSLSELLDKERENQNDLDVLKYRKIDLDTEIRQYLDINEKLSHLVSIIQKTEGTEEEDNNCKNDEIHFKITETMEDFEQVKLEHSRLVITLDQMEMNIKQNASDIKSLINENQTMVVDIHRNDSMIRLLEQQGKYTEQQFDLIINQLPWEPLADEYIEELRKSCNQTIRNLAETLQLQKGEIEDLNESLSFKKKKKLDVLEELYEKLNTFAQKRDEAILVTRFID